MRIGRQASLNPDSQHSPVCFKAHFPVSQCGAVSAVANFHDCKVRHWHHAYISTISKSRQVFAYEHDHCMTGNRALLPNAVNLLVSLGLDVDDGGMGAEQGAEIVADVLLVW